jgi:hypothetical protein
VDIVSKRGVVLRDCDERVDPCDGAGIVAGLRENGGKLGVVPAECLTRPALDSAGGVGEALQHVLGDTGDAVVAVV